VILKHRMCPIDTYSVCYTEYGISCSNCQIPLPCYLDHREATWIKLDEIADLWYNKSKMPMGQDKHMREEVANNWTQAQEDLETSMQKR